MTSTKIGYPHKADIVRKEAQVMNLDIFTGGQVPFIRCLSNAPNSQIGFAYLQHLVDMKKLDYEMHFLLLLLSEGRGAFA